MKEIALYRWRTLWLGKWSTTRYATTEEEIRKVHPDAKRLDHTREVRLVPETMEDYAANSTGGAQHGPEVR